MRMIIRLSTAAAGLLLAGAALAAGPVNPPPSSCGVTEVYTCQKIGDQVFCACEPRDISSGPTRESEPRALKGKPQHLVNLGSGATGQSTDKP